MTRTSKLLLNIVSSSCLNTGSAIPLTLILRLAVTDWLGDTYTIEGESATRHPLLKPYVAAAAALADLSRFEDECPALQSLGEAAKVTCFL